jgi:hypothetical protein
MKRGVECQTRRTAGYKETNETTYAGRSQGRRSVKPV